MKRVIYKYPIPILDDIVTIETGTKPIVRHIGYQGGVIR